MSQKDWKPIEYKFVLLGDSLVGKSSIFYRLAGKKYSEDMLSTVGTDKLTLNMNQVKIEINEEIYIKNFNITLFDTAGQERYREITKNYFKGSHGIILIYDITSKSSFEHIVRWLESIKETLSDWKKSGYMIMILGNKLDLVENDEKNRAVTLEEGKNICSKNDIYWGGECSAKTFEVSQIKEIIETFLKKVYIKLIFHNEKKFEPKKIELKIKHKKGNCGCIQSDS